MVWYETDVCETTLNQGEHIKILETHHVYFDFICGMTEEFGLESTF